VKIVTGVIGTNCLFGVHGVGGTIGAGGDRVLYHVEEVSVHGIERAHVPPLTPSPSRAMSFVLTREN